MTLASAPPARTRSRTMRLKAKVAAWALAVACRVAASASTSRARKSWSNWRDRRSITAHEGVSVQLAPIAGRNDPCPGKRKASTRPSVGKAGGGPVACAVVVRQDPDEAGRVVMVTGGNRGIGLACARAFAGLGD